VVLDQKALLKDLVALKDQVDKDLVQVGLDQKDLADLVGKDLARKDQVVLDQKAFLKDLVVQAVHKVFNQLLKCNSLVMQLA